jgi:hypothetical protein
MPSKAEKTLLRVLSGMSDANIAFGDLCSLAEELGFQGRHRGGSHTIYSRAGIAEIINVQPAHDGHHAKPYQVKQVRNIILKYRLRLPE